MRDETHRKARTTEPTSGCETNNRNSGNETFPDLVDRTGRAGCPSFVHVHQEGHYGLIEFDVSLAPVNAGDAKVRFNTNVVIHADKPERNEQYGALR